MTLPASGAIAISQISTEIALSSTATNSLSFIKSKTKAAYQQASPTMSNYYSNAYYTNNTAGNCNNGNCNCDCACNCNYNCGNCYDCQVCSAINCANCDATPSLQPNCNCACSYNCSTTGSYRTCCDSPADC